MTQPDDQAPEIQSLSPTSGSAGTEVAIAGRLLAGATEVLFGDSLSPNWRDISGNDILATAPAGPTGRVAVTVTTPGGTDRKLDAFQYPPPPPPPTIAGGGIAPWYSGSRGGIQIIIAGTNFTSDAGVTFGGTPSPAVEVLAPDVIRCVVPAAPPGGGYVPVRVTTPGGTATVNNGYWYDPGPAPYPSVRLHNVVPARGSGGTRIRCDVSQITGSKEPRSHNVLFGDRPGRSIGFSPINQLEVTAPAHPAGVVSVSVYGPGGSDTRPNSFTYD